ncbi:MAG: arylsulfatase [Saprospiraceae bacterium]|nr:arylsulfatase [Saprospiraceae bacterium]
MKKRSRTCRIHFIQAAPLLGLAFLLLAFAWSSLSSCSPPEDKLPNIIYVLADDMGYGDVSALNPESKIKTPHLDQLARSGLTFTDAHSGSSVCTPTRYGILTGRYAWRTTLKKGVTWSWDPPLIDNERLTVADVLKSHSYHTACVGKWHLGLGWQKNAGDTPDITKPILEGPNDLGFDYFFGITASLDIPPYVYIENDQSTSLDIDTIAAKSGKEFWRRGPIGHDFVHEEVLPKITAVSCGLIDSFAQEEDPFFLYFPLPAPHTPILPTDEFKGKSKTNAYGDFVLQVDDVVGQIMAALKRNKIADNTIVIFTSDNGCSPMANFDELAEIGHHPSHHFRGHKADIFDGGHRVPFLVHWPKHTAPGMVSDETICLTDFMATVADVVGDSLPPSAGEDSYSFRDILHDATTKISRAPVIHHSINGSFAIRDGNWKLNLCPGSGGWSTPTPKEVQRITLPDFQLYDLTEDPGEENNLIANHPRRVAQMRIALEQAINNGRTTPGPAQENDSETSSIPQI